MDVDGERERGGVVAEPWLNLDRVILGPPASLTRAEEEVAALSCRPESPLIARVLGRDWGGPDGATGGADRGGVRDKGAAL